jgi:hypothetical protein
LLGKVWSMTSGDSVDNIVDRVRTAATPDTLDQLDTVVTRMVAAEEEVRGFLRTIRSRPTTMFYIGASRVRARSPNLTLSVRIDGVECGQVKLTGSPERIFTPSNPRYFGPCWMDLEPRLPWGHPAVKRYVACVSEMTLSGPLGTREAALEAATLRSIRAGGAPWRHQAVVTYPVRGGIPYQFPLPASPRGGAGSAGSSGVGHSDILLRRGLGRSSRLRVLELKKPRAADVAASLGQAVAYAAAIDLLMRRGTAYRALLGYQNFTPPLEATAFVEDSPEARDALSDALAQLQRESTRLPGLRLSALFYRWEPRRGGEVEVTHGIPQQLR